MENELIDAGVVPSLSYSAPTVVNGGSGSIAIGDSYVHRIADMEAFYAGLGFKQDASGRLSPEEFIWDRYRRDGALKCRDCLQIQLCHYLYTHSDYFKIFHGRAYEAKFGTCGLDCVATADEHCRKCPMHTIEQEVVTS